MVNTHTREQQKSKHSGPLCNSEKLAGKQVPMKPNEESFIEIVMSMRNVKRRECKLLFFPFHSQFGANQI